MDYIKKKFIEKALPVRDEVKSIIKNHGSKVIGEISIEQALTGMKGAVSLLTLTSKLDPNEGIRFRGYTIPELREKLPKLGPEGEPLPEGLFYLLLLDELPTQDDVNALSKEWAKRAEVPQHVFDVIESLPITSRPMTQFSSAILALAPDSLFESQHRKGMNKSDYWDPTYEDVMNLIAKLPRIAAYIYRRVYHNGDHIAPDPSLDWAGNLAHMMGFDGDEIKRLLRLYMVIHADHEGGNVSAHTTHLVGSAQSNVFYSYSAGMLGLAGPLHGMANQEVIKWIHEMKEELGQQGSSDPEKVREYIKKTLSSGRVIPGFGHAVLRVTDPRYMAQREFCLKYFPEEPMFKIVDTLFKEVPPILESLGKVKNPWPNVDAHSGMLLSHYGITEYLFYTVLFGVSRSLGVLAQFVWDKALGVPIERPKSQNLEFFRNAIK